MKRTTTSEACPHCASPSLRHAWQHFRNGTRHIRVTCTDCGRFMGFAPQTPSNVARAEAGSNPTGLLDVLVALDGLGVDVQSDGRQLVLSDWQRLSPALRTELALQQAALVRLLRRVPRFQETTP